MKIVDQSRKGAIAKVKVELPGEELESRIEKAFNLARKNIKLDGFRSGKVPLSIIKKRFGESIKQETIDEYIKEHYGKILDETNLRPVTPGEIQEVEHSQGEDLKFTVQVELKPELTLGDSWHNTKVIKEVVKVTDKDIDNHIEILRRNNAIVAERLDDEAIQDKDRLTVDIQEMDASGVPIVGNHREDIAFEIGYNALGADTDSQLLGAKKGEEITVYTVRNKLDEQGNEIEEQYSWQVKINKIESIELPELDEDFFTQINDQTKTLEDFRENVKKNLEMLGKYHTDQRLSARMIDKMIELNPMDLPPTLLAETLDRMVKSHMEESNNMVPADSIRGQLVKVAEDQLKWYFLREQIINDEDIKATDEDIEKELQQRYANNQQIDLESLKLMFKSGEKRDQISGVIIETKIMDVLHKGFAFEEREVDLQSVLNQG